MQFRGKILQNGQVLFPNVVGTMHTSLKLEGSSGTTGHFTLPRGADIGPGEGYEIVLTDGRKAGLQVLNVAGSAPAPKIAHFKLQGGFQ